MILIIITIFWGKKATFKMATPRRTFSKSIFTEPWLNCLGKKYDDDNNNNNNNNN